MRKVQFLALITKRPIIFTIKKIKMEFKITVERIEKLQEDKYPNKIEIFTQLVEDLDVVKVINAINEKK